jgi:hypothetical protein
MSTTKKISKKKLIKLLSADPDEFEPINDFLYRKVTQKEWLREYHQWKKKRSNNC